MKNCVEMHGHCLQYLSQNEPPLRLKHKRRSAMAGNTSTDTTMSPFLCTLSIYIARTHNNDCADSLNRHQFVHQNEHVRPFAAEEFLAHQLTVQVLLSYYLVSYHEGNSHQKKHTLVDIPSLATWMLSSERPSVAILTGASVSVASGIPNSRRRCGLYATFRPKLLTATPHQLRLTRRLWCHGMSFERISSRSWKFDGHHSQN